MLGVLFITGGPVAEGPIPTEDLRVGIRQVKKGNTEEVRRGTDALFPMEKSCAPFRWRWRKDLATNFQIDGIR